MPIPAWLQTLDSRCSKYLIAVSLPVFLSWVVAGASLAYAADVTSV
jgi:hypothetical protein